MKKWHSHNIPHLVFFKNKIFLFYLKLSYENSATYEHFQYFQTKSIKEIYDI